MPRYIYKCETCEDEFLIHHSIGENLEKKEGCEKECVLHRIPQPTLLKNKKLANKKVGEVVKEYIENTKEELKLQKQEFKEQEYIP